MKKVNDQKAIGLLELMLVLAVIAGMIIAATSFFGIASREARISAAITQISTVVEGSYVWARSQPSFSGINMTKLSSGNYINYGFGSGSKQNPWGGDITVGQSGSKVRVTLKELPSDIICTNLKDKLASKSTAGTCSKDGTTYYADF